MANGGLSYQFIDTKGKTGSTNVQTGAVTAVSLPGLLTQIGTLRSALAGITLGTISQESLYVFRTRLSNEWASDVSARRERTFIVHYEDVTQFFDDPVNSIPNEGFGKNFTVSIPTADLGNDHMQPNSDLADLANEDMAAFVAAFEAVVKSPYGGAVNVTYIEAGGANL